MLRILHFLYLLTSSFLNDSLLDNHWAGHSVTKPVDAVASQKSKLVRECNDDESANFEMDINDEGVLDKELECPDFLDGPTPGGNVLRPSMINTSNNQKLSF